jgi:hypothetical protein
LAAGSENLELLKMFTTNNGENWQDKLDVNFNPEKSALAYLADFWNEPADEDDISGFEYLLTTDDYVNWQAKLSVNDKKAVKACTMNEDECMDGLKIMISNPDNGFQDKAFIDLEAKYDSDDDEDDEDAETYEQFIADLDDGEEILELIQANSLRRKLSSNL